MAGVQFNLTANGVASGTAAQTVVQVAAAANHRVLVRGFSITAEDSSASMLVQLIRQTDAGTGGTGLTEQKIDEGYDETIQAVGIKSPSVEPTGTEVVWEGEMKDGMIVPFPVTRPIVVKGGNRLGLVVTASADKNVAATLECEE